MDALLLALRRARRWARRGPWIVGGLLALSGGIPFFPASGNACDSLPDPSRSWSAKTQSRIHASFAATGVPYAENAWSTAASGIDGFLDRWESTRGRVCAGKVDEAALRCLHRSAVVFDAVVTEYAAVKASNVALIHPLVSLLRSPEFCEDSADDVISVLESDILREIEAGRAQASAGRGEAAARTLTNMIEDPRLAGTDALAEAYRLRAAAMRLMSRRANALDDLASSMREGKDPVTRGRTVVAWLVELTRQERWESAQDARRLVEGHVTNAMPLGLRADATVARAALLAQQEQAENSVTLYSEAIELWSRLGDPVNVANARLGLASVLMQSDEQASQDRALDLFHDVIQTYEEHLGRMHPHSAAALYDLGIFHADTRLDWASAEPLLREAYEIESRTLPAESTEIARTRVKLGEVLLNLGKLDEAILHAEAGWLRVGSLPATNSDHVAGLRLLANVTIESEDYEASLTHHTALGFITPTDAFIQQNLAHIHIKLENVEGATDALGRTRALIGDMGLDDETAALFELFLRGLDAELLAIDGNTGRAIAVVDEVLAATSRPGLYAKRPDLGTKATELQKGLRELRDRLGPTDAAPPSAQPTP